MAQPTTLRALAAQLCLSVATVSEALRDSPRVTAATRERVQRAARRAGYRPNPLLGAVMSAVRRTRHQHYRGTLALVDTVEENPAQYLLFHRQIVAGARERAKQLGFQVELFWLGERSPALNRKRLAQVLRARGITGVVLLPFNTAQDLSSFDFSQLSAVQMDHCLLAPRLHTVLPEHYMSMRAALERLRRSGYRRIGLCLEERKDARLSYKWTAGFESFARNHPPGATVPPMLSGKLTAEKVQAWFRRHRPDVIVGHVPAIADWIRALLPKSAPEIGFFNLNLTESPRPCAGFDLGPRRLAAAAIETVVAMLHRQERGVPAYPQTITLEAEWIDGPTLRRTPSSGS
jgi:LacI family transcriptional regulator